MFIFGVRVPRLVPAKRWVTSLSSWKSAAKNWTLLKTSVISGGKKLAAGITSFWRMASKSLKMVEERGMSAMDLLELHDQERRARGARGLLVGVPMLIASLVMGGALLTSPLQVTSASSDTSHAPSRQEVANLREVTENQAREIRQLKALFDVCLSDDRVCRNTTEQPSSVMYTSTPSHQGTSTKEVHTKVVSETVKQEQSTPKASSSPKKSSPPSAPDPVKKVKETVDKSTKKVNKTVKDVLDKTAKATKK